MTRRVRILNIEVDNFSMEEFLSELDEGFVVTPNADHMVMLQRDPVFRAAYASADYRTVDSQIVAWACRFLGTPVKQKISGSDLLPAYYNYHRDNEDIRIFLLGGANGVARKAAENINRRVGRNIVVGHHSPSMGFEKDPQECSDVIDIVNSSGANVLVVGLGAPKQEIWIAKHRSRLTPIKIFLALGATIDFEAGNVKRAPAWISKCGCEWLYRLSREPGRLWRRYLQRDILFPILVIRQKLGLYTPPTE